MRLFGRRPEPVRADLDAGFWVAEAPALQSAIRTALGGAPAGDALVRTEVTFGPGAQGRVVVTSSNLIVGFVPPEWRDHLLDQLMEAGRAPLVGEARAHRHGSQWRIWAGPPWPEGQLAPAYPVPQIAPEPAQIFGVQLRTPPQA